MRMELEKATTKINPDHRRFELKVGDQTAFIEYILNQKGVIYLTHTEVPKLLEGKGVGSKIVRETLTYIEENEYLLAPLCPFVAAYLKEHQEFNDLLAPGFSIA